MPPARSAKKMMAEIEAETRGSECPVRVCDILIMVVLVASIGFTMISVYRQTRIEEARLEEESILCIKDFDSRGCNPFNMTEACQQKLDCIKSGDGVGMMGVLDIANSQIKNNGVVPLIMIMIVIANEIRRRLTQDNQI